MPLIRDAILAAVTQERTRPPSSHAPKLWVSDAGQCPRKAMLRIQGYTGRPFEPATLEVMRAGVVWEDETRRALVAAYGEDRVTPQLYLGNDAWSGKSDMVLDLGTPNVVLIEHKAVGDKWFDYQQGLPRPEHVAQLALYGRFYRETYDVEPALLLYYRSWGQWAEFTLTVHPDSVGAYGLVNDAPRERILDLSIDRIRAELEGYYRAGTLPPRLANPEHGCTSRGKVWCPMYDHCWPAAVNNHSKAS